MKTYIMAFIEKMGRETDLTSPVQETFSFLILRSLMWAVGMFITFLKSKLWIKQINLYGCGWRCYYILEAAFKVCFIQYFLTQYLSSPKKEKEKADVAATFTTWCCKLLISHAENSPAVAFFFLYDQMFSHCNMKPCDFYLWENDRCCISRKLGYVHSCRRQESL